MLLILEGRVSLDDEAARMLTKVLKKNEFRF